MTPAEEKKLAELLAQLRKLDRRVSFLEQLQKPLDVVATKRVGKSR